MLRFLLKLALGCIVLSTLTIFISRAVGSTRPVNPVLRGFTEGCEGQPQPCWYGIVPGRSKFSDARKWVQSWDSQEYREIESTATFDVNTRTVGSRFSPDSCYSFFHSTRPSSVVDYIELSDCPDLQFGDLINQFGAPDKIQFRIGIWGQFGEIAFILDSQGDVFNPRTKPRMLIMPSTDNVDLFFDWHGFASHRRYCQLEPQNYTCPQ
ncbi:MAG: hypothetical protein LCI00_25200 [Chloroflexi bacterium]|nr:hypothetical protein [Chloroflexota bacterium]MCC6895716.1 hypothetical protein [Anaerolineae bacterium]